MIITQEKLTTIRLGGQLGKTFGKVHQFYISSPGEAIRALASQLDGFADYLVDPKRHTKYKVLVGKVPIDPNEELNELSGSKEIRISPVIQGAKRGGAFQMVLGAVLIAVSFFIPPAAMLAGVAINGMVLTMGVGMMVGGVAQMLSPQPKLDISEAPENSPSKNFSGPINTQAAGQPVPLVYGRATIGSASVSAGLYASDTNG